MTVRTDAARVGIVAIGRNEGQRLHACLTSVCNGERAVVYVDSGSTDGSVTLAESFGARVVKLDMSRPFSAGRARNEGFARLRQEAPKVEYVQFLDGDCELIPGWLTAASAALDGDPGLAVVCGRRRERHPDRSVYNLLCDIEWDTPVGTANSSGGDAMMRADAFASVGGFNPGMVAGEEPELCVRLRAQGFRVQRLPEEMTLHDADMHSFRQWWKRTTRAGHAYAELAALHGSEPGRPAVRQSASNLAWGAALPAALSVAGPAGAFAGSALYSVLAFRIYRRQLDMGRTHRQAVTYAVACTVGKFPQTLGMARYWLGALTGRRSRIIEYKT